MTGHLRYAGASIILMVAPLWLPSGASADTFSADRYYTWGIDGGQLQIPEGSIITEAVLTIHDVGGWDNRLNIHLIDNPPLGFVANTDVANEDFFADFGGLLNPAPMQLTDNDLVIVFSQVDDGDSWVYGIYDRPFNFQLADGSTVAYSSALLELIDCAGNGTPFGFGLDPEADYQFTGMTLEISVASYEGAPNSRTLVLDALLPTVDITRCTVRAGRNENQDSISFSGVLNATADSFTETDELSVVIDGEYMPEPISVAFPVDEKSFRNGAYRSSVFGVDRYAPRMTFTYNCRSGRFTFSAVNMDLTGLSCPISVQIQIGDFAAAATLDEDTVNGSQIVPLQFLAGISDRFCVSRCSVKAGKTAALDGINLSALLNASADDLASADQVALSISGDRMPRPLTIVFPMAECTLTKGICRSRSVKTDRYAPRTAFVYNSARGTFTFTASNVDLTGISCPINVNIQIGDFAAATVLDESTVNGARPVPLSLMRDVE